MLTEGYRHDGIADCTGFEEGEWIFCCSSIVNVWTGSIQKSRYFIFLSISVCMHFIHLMLLIYLPILSPFPIPGLSQLQELTLHLGGSPLHNLRI